MTEKLAKGRMVRSSVVDIWSLPGWVKDGSFLPPTRKEWNYSKYSVPYVAYEIKLYYGRLRPSVKNGSSYLGYPNIHRSFYNHFWLPIQNWNLLNLSFHPFGCGLDAFYTSFYNQVAFRNDLIKSSQKIEGSDICLAWSSNSLIT